MTDCVNFFTMPLIAQRFRLLYLLNYIEIIYFFRYPSNMASKLQKYFVELINLRKEVNALKETSINGDDLMFLAGLRDKYIKWFYVVIKEKKLNKFASVYAFDLSISDLIKNGGVGSVARYFEVKDLLQKEINSCVEFFSRIETMPITIKVPVLSTNNTHKKESKFPIKLPAGTTWENFTIKFMDDENVLIYVVGKQAKVSFKEMGFEDKRKNSVPNSQWLLLKLLAKYNGELNWDKPEADEKIKKSKERLIKKLKSYFSIDYDPFHPYIKVRSYKIKITLIPPLVEEEISKQSLSDETENIFESLVQ